MAIFKGHGIPTKHTPGNIGDIYEDLDTNLRYECVLAYGTSASSEPEYRWVFKKNTQGEKVIKETRATKVIRVRKENQEFKVQKVIRVRKENQEFKVQKVIRRLLLLYLIYYVQVRYILLNFLFGIHLIHQLARN